MKIILPFLLIFAVNIVAEAKETIYWAKYDFRPFFMLKTNEIGIGDHIYKELQAKLPEYNHKNYTSTVPRILRDIKGTKLICTGLLTKEQKDNNILYSLPVIQMPSISIQFDKDQLDNIENLTGVPFTSPVSIKPLVQSDLDIKIGIMNRRYYGTELDQIIKEYPDKFIGIERHLGIKEHIDFTRKGRIRFTLEYPIVSFSEFQNTAVSPLHSIAIADTSHSLQGSIACSNTTSGIELMNKLNQEIKQQWLTTDHIKIVEKWVPPNSIEHYRKHYHEFQQSFK